MQGMLPKFELLRNYVRCVGIVFCTSAMAWIGGAGCRDDINCFEFPYSPQESDLTCSKSSDCTLVDVPDLWTAEGYPIDDETYCRFPIAEKRLDRYQRDLEDFIAVCGEKRSPPGTVPPDCASVYGDVFPICRESQCSRGIRGLPLPTY